MQLEGLGALGLLPARMRGQQGSQSLGVFQAHGRLFDTVKRGKCFSAATAATGVAPGTAVGTAAAFALYNPSGSGVDVVILEGRLGYVSGTLGAGVIHWCVNENKAAALPTGTAITEQNMLVGSQGGNQAAAFTSATLPAAPSLLRVFGSLDAALATSVVGPWVLTDVVDGAIVLEPGTIVSLQATAAAGTAPLVVYSVTFEEVARN